MAGMFGLGGVIVYNKIGMEYTDSATEVAEVRLSLPAFDGPLDLLLHLIRKNKIDIYDIPVQAVPTNT
ncbi:MAG: hypothetical protein MR209_02935 [Veillonellaceae bacterium]|nr:hypothetical protein [Veillonellaceae bacterium]